MSEPDYLLASKAFGASRRGPILVDGMAADASTRNLLAGVVLAITITASLGIIFVSVYALRYKINHFFRQHGINIEVVVPHDGRSLRR